MSIRDDIKNPQSAKGSKMAHCDRKEGNTTGPDLGRRRESLRLFNELLRLGDDPDLSIEETFNKIARLIPACWHDPEAICSRIIFQGAQYKSINFRETDKKLYSELMAEGRTVGSIEVCHTRPGPDCDEGAFIEEERELLESLAWKLGRIISGKEAATASKDSQKFYRMVQELSDVGTWVWDIVNNNIDWSDDVIRLWGYARDDFRGTIEEVARRVHPDDLEAWRENVRACIEDGKEHRLEMRIILPGGKVRWMDAYGNAERDDQGKAVRMMGIVMDITDRKLAEEDLRREKQRLNITGDMARVGGWEIDLGNNTVFWTRTTRDIHEVSEEYVPTLEEAMDFFPEAREVIEEAVRRAREENIPYDLEIPFLTAKGRKLWTRTIGKPEFEGGKCARLHGVFQDITEKREVEEALRQRERLLTWAIEQLPIPVIIADAPDVSISRYNKAAFDLLAIPTEHLEDIELGEHREFWPTFYPDGSPYDVLDLPLTRAIRKGEISKDLEIILRKTDGDHWISASAAPLRDENGNIMAGIVVFPEITDRKLAEHEITESRTFLDTIIDKSPFAMWISDPGGTVIRTNHALHEALNLTSDQIVGHYNVLKDKNLEMQGLLPRIKQVFEDFKPTRFIVSWEAEKAGDVDFDGGSDLHIDASMFPIVSAEGDLEHVVCQWVDISDLKRVENELRNITRNLDLLVKERTLDLEAANRELESFAFSRLARPARSLAIHQGVRRYNSGMLS